jgi:hypothetical protein
VIGRVVAKGGMSVMVARGQLEVAGTHVAVDFRDEVSFYDVDTARAYDVLVGIEKLGNTEHGFMVRDGYNLSIRPASIPGGSVYLLSDNRSYTGHDSRAFGPVDVRSCIGTVFMRLTPIDDHGAGFGHRYLEIIR